MKNSKLYNKSFLILFIALLLFTTSCNEMIDDVENLSAYEPSKVWSSEVLTNSYLNDLYASSMPSWPLDGGHVDEAGPGIITTDYITTQNGTLKYWPYSTLRKINILFEEIDLGNLEEDVKNKIKGQAHFLRAWHYFKMVSYHGGVPIIQVPQSLEDDLAVPRNSTAECFDFILQDLDAAIGLLPNKYSGNDFGRIDKAACLAFKGRILLYKASPQFNSDNPFDNSFWADAYTANKTAKDQLERFGYGLVSNYEDIFESEQNQEVVLATIYVNPGKTNGRREHGVRPLTESKNATGNDQPTWSLVQAYPMLDGKMPGNSAKYEYNLQEYWQNRDPRFYKTIVYNGAIWELSGKAGRRQYTTADLIPAGLTHEDDIFGNNQNFGRTGFYCKKGIQEELPQAEVETNSIDWVEIRFAEVLLNYAEAANETNRTNEAYDVLKTIRSRAGIEPGDDSMYGLNSGMTREEMRDAIYQERRIEFAFEGKRFSDLRRARRWHLLDGTKKYGLEAFLKEEFKNPDGSLTKDEFLPEDFTYEVREVLNTIKEMVVPETYYFYPIKKSDIEKNPNLEQTIGWDGGTFNPEL